MKALSAIACFVLTVGPCLADGGAIVARQVLNGLDITIFASPVPLRAGPADISVLVQDEVTKEPILSAEVEVSWSSIASTSAEWMPPCCSMATSLNKFPAVRNHSQNKFLYSAIVPIRNSGESELAIQVKDGERVAMISSDIAAGPARSPARAYWPFLALPPFAICGFVLHQRLSRRRE